MLKPSTDYRFSEADFRFVLELAKCGYVHLLTAQVSLQSDKQGLSFTHYSSEPAEKCDGLKLPENWLIEAISSNDNGIRVLFAVKPAKQ